MLINCELIIHLITNSTGAGTSAITNKRLYVLVVTLSIQDKPKLLQKSKSGFKRSINQNKFATKDRVQTQNRNLYYLLKSSLQGPNRLFPLFFENEVPSRGHVAYYLSKVEISNYSVEINGRHFLISQLVMSQKHMKTFEKPPMVKEMTIQLFASWIIHTSKKKQKKLQDNFKRSEQIQNVLGTQNCFHFQRSQRNYLGFLTRNCESIINTFYELLQCCYTMTEDHNVNVIRYQISG